MTLVQTWSRLNRMNNEQMGKANLLRSLAVLEAWCIYPGEEWVRSFKVEMANSLLDLPWTVILTYRAETREVHGRTMEDALAQAAQVVTSNPKLED